MIPALTQDRASALDIPMMTQVSGTPNQTAFTIPAEAKDAISTGISAHDRAHTISVAIDPAKRPSDITSPGHDISLVARLADLIAYRRKYDRFVRRKVEAPFESHNSGEWPMVVYVNELEYAEHIAPEGYDLNIVGTHAIRGKPGDEE